MWMNPVTARKAVIITTIPYDGISLPTNYISSNTVVGNYQFPNFGPTFATNYISKRNLFDGGLNVWSFTSVLAGPPLPTNYISSNTVVGNYQFPNFGPTFATNYISSNTSVSFPPL